MRLLKPQTIAASVRAVRLQQPRVLHTQTRHSSNEPESSRDRHREARRASYQEEWDQNRHREARRASYQEEWDQHRPYGLPELPRPQAKKGTNTT